MTQSPASSTDKQDYPQQPEGVDAVLVLEDGTVYWGYGAGAQTTRVGEVIFNTAMTGYQEILTDPSYAGQIIGFTFPHIGNVGANIQDEEGGSVVCMGMIAQEMITKPSNYRASSGLDHWLETKGLPAICGVDMRALTARIRQYGAPKGVLSHQKECVFDLASLHAQAKNWQGLEGLDLASDVSIADKTPWSGGGLWQPDADFAANNAKKHHVVAIDYGMKRNIARCFDQIGAKVTIVPYDHSAEAILALKPDGIFLSNGPGDPAATYEEIKQELRTLIDSGVPIFGICLGHQLLGLALGAKTAKMQLGHHGANHPIQDLTTQKVEITSQNHGFVVDKDNLPESVEPTHFSLFDGSLAGMRVKDKPIFSVQYHPEASPGPQDSFYLFDRFQQIMAQSADAAK